VPGVDGGGEVDAQCEAPQPGQRGRVRGEQVAHDECALGPARGVVDGGDQEAVVAVRSGVHGGQQELVPVDQAPQRLVPPRLRARHRAGPAERDPRVQRDERGQHLGPGQLPHPTASGRAGPPARAAPADHLHPPGPGGDAVAEAAVDAGLGGAQRRQHVTGRRALG
jgi:hypothetical protein